MGAPDLGSAPLSALLLVVVPLVSCARGRGRLWILRGGGKHGGSRTGCREQRGMLRGMGSEPCPERARCLPSAQLRDHDAGVLRVHARLLP